MKKEVAKFASFKFNNKYDTDSKCVLVANLKELKLALRAHGNLGLFASNAQTDGTQGPKQLSAAVGIQAHHFMVDLKYIYQLLGFCMYKMSLPFKW